MASINYAAREISVKIVYYGPGLSGKTTNLQVIHRKVPIENRSDMVSLATETDRTLFFDFLPLDLGKIKGFTTKFQLYTVPGQVYYNATRKLVLRGVDGVVFVADSNPEKMEENLESFQNLEENLVEYGYQRENIPIVLQYNKRDLPNALPIEEMERQFNKYHLPWCEGVAARGKGVFETLKLIGKIVLDYLNKKYSRHDTAAPAPAHAAAPQSVPAMQQPRPAAPQTPPQQQRMVQPSPVQPPPPVRQTPPPATRTTPVADFPAFTAEPPQPRAAVTSRPAAPADPFLSPNTQPPVPQHPVQRPAAAPQRAPAPPTQDYMDYGAINLESMEQPVPQRVPKPAPPSAGLTDTHIARMSSLDREIETYQHEIVQKQRAQAMQPQTDEAMFEIKSPSRQPQQQQFQQPPAARPQPPHAQQSVAPQYTQQPFPPQHANEQPRQQPAFQPQQGYQQPPKQNFQGFQQFQPPPPPQQRQAQTSEGQNPEKDYGVYNFEPTAQGAPQRALPHAPDNSQKTENADDTMYFTSVDTDRAKKGKKPVNPKMQQNKGFLGKIFNRNKPE